MHKPLQPIKHMKERKKSFNVNYVFPSSGRLQKPIHHLRIMKNVGYGVCWSANEVMAQGKYTH